MKDYTPSLNVPALAVAGLGFVAALIGGFDVPAQALLVLQILDLAMGMLAAAYTGKLDSGECRKGAVRKLVQWAVVMAAVQADNLVGQGHLARTGALMVLCSAEGLSVLELASVAGVKLPPQLQSMFAKLRESGSPVSLTADPDPQPEAVKA